MYFIGYSKWLLLSSRLVAGDHSSTLHVHSKITPQTCVDVVFPYQFVWCVSFRCRCRSRLFHFRFPDSQHTARGASRDRSLKSVHIKSVELHVTTQTEVKKKAHVINYWQPSTALLLTHQFSNYLILSFWYYTDNRSCHNFNLCLVWFTYPRHVSLGTMEEEEKDSGIWRSIVLVKVRGKLI